MAHAGVHILGARKLLRDRRPILNAFIETHATEDEIIKYLDAPDMLDHSAPKGDHSYKLETIDGKLRPHIKSTANQHTVLTRLQGDYLTAQDFLREGEHRAAALLICKSIHWRIDARTPPHVEWVWSDKAHAAIENDLDRSWDRHYSTIPLWPEEELHDLYRDIKHDVEDAFVAYQGLRELYEAGGKASDEQQCFIVHGIAIQLNRYLAQVERIVIKGGHA